VRRDGPIEGSVAIVAGGGRLPFEVARSAQAQGREVHVFAIRGVADPDIESLSPVWFDWGQAGRLIDSIAAKSCANVVLIGNVSVRPSYRAIAGDPATLRRLPGILRVLIGGDDTVLRKVINLFEGEGFRIVGAHQIAPDLLLGEGKISKRGPKAVDLENIAAGHQALLALGNHDIGQGLVIGHRGIIAVEAAEGTDAMIERCGTLFASGRFSSGGAGYVLVKGHKSGQDERTDLPTIGPVTIEMASNAGLVGVAAEAGKVLVAERSKMLDLAKKHKLFVFGYDSDGL
jgi:DUF1009 family protein